MCFVTFLRFTFGTTPADLLVASIAAKPILIYILAHIQAMVGLETGMECAAASQYVTGHVHAVFVSLVNTTPISYLTKQIHVLFFSDFAEGQVSVQCLI